MARGRQAESWQVEGEDPAALGQCRCHQHPVQMRSAESVHQDDRAGVGGAAEVDPVHRAV